MIFTLPSDNSNEIKLLSLKMLSRLFKWYHITTKIILHFEGYIFMIIKLFSKPFRLFVTSNTVKKVDERISILLNYIFYLEIGFYKFPEQIYFHSPGFKISFYTSKTLFPSILFMCIIEWRIFILWKILQITIQ
jgi:hypothetical protein